jgi:hypothetical protein
MVLSIVWRMGAIPLNLPRAYGKFAKQRRSDN